MAKLAIAFVLICVVVLSQGKSVRQKRDLICAASGNEGCNLSCKGRGYKDGECAWDTETGAFDCNCSSERRGIRCNLGGPNVCKYGCMATGHLTGICVDGDKCQCSDEMNAWGDLIRDIKGRL